MAGICLVPPHAALVMYLTAGLSAGPCIYYCMQYLVKGPSSMLYDISQHDSVMVTASSPVSVHSSSVLPSCGMQHAFRLLVCLKKDLWQCTQWSFIDAADVSGCTRANRVSICTMEASEILLSRHFWRFLAIDTFKSVCRFFCLLLRVILDCRGMLASGNEHS